MSILVAFSLVLSSCDKKNALLVNRRTATLKRIEEIKEEQRAKQEEADMESINCLTTLVKTLADTATPVPLPDAHSSATPARAAALDAARTATFKATKRTLDTAIKAIKHAYAVVNRPALVGKTAFDTAKAFTAAVQADSDIASNAHGVVLAVRAAAAAAHDPAITACSSDDANAARYAALAAFYATAFTEHIIAEVVDNIAHCHCERSADANDNAFTTAARYADAARYAADEAELAHAATSHDASALATAANAFVEKAKDLEKRFKNLQSQKTQSISC